MITTLDIHLAARSWIGVPFTHQGRSRDGVDCVGLVICVARELGLVPMDADANGYRRAPDGSMLEQCDVWLDRSPLDVAHVAAIRFSVAPQHLAILVPHHHNGQAFVHALQRNGAVVSHRVDATWRDRIVQGYRFRGVA